MKNRKSAKLTKIYTNFYITNLLHLQWATKASSAIVIGWIGMQWTTCEIDIRIRPLLLRELIISKNVFRAILICLEELFLSILSMTFFSNSYSLNLNCSAIHRGRLNQTSNSNEMQSMGISNKNGCRNVKAKVDFAFRSCEMNENNLLNFVIYLKT